MLTWGSGLLPVWGAVTSRTLQTLPADPTTTAGLERLSCGSGQGLTAGLPGGGGDRAWALTQALSLTDNPHVGFDALQLPS